MASNQCVYVRARERKRKFRECKIWGFNQKLFKMVMESELYSSEVWSDELA